MEKEPSGGGKMLFMKLAARVQQRELGPPSPAPQVRHKCYFCNFCGSAHKLEMERHFYYGCS